MDLDSLLELFRIKILPNKVQKLIKGLIRYFSRALSQSRLIYRELAFFESISKCIEMAGCFVHRDLLCHRFIGDQFAMIMANRAKRKKHHWHCSSIK